MSFCPNCGTPVTPGTASCPKCGGPAGQSAAPPPSPFINAPSPSAYSPAPPGMMGAPLPNVSPLAIILAAVAWVFGGPLLSIPAIFLARADIRGCREGRYNPAGLTQSQLAFWIALVNCILILLVCGIYLVVIVFFIGGMGFMARTAVKEAEEIQKYKMQAQVQEYSALEAEIDRKIATRTPKEQELWKSVKANWADLRKEKGKQKGSMPETTPTTELLKLVRQDHQLWAQIMTAEMKVAQECSLDPPSRPTLPSESGGGKHDFD